MRHGARCLSICTINRLSIRNPAHRRIVQTSVIPELRQRIELSEIRHDPQRPGRLASVQESESRVHPIQCQCGTVRGLIKGAGTTNRVVCYCTDCQAFARFLGRPDDVLDAHGGTEVVQVGLPRLSLTQGRERLAAVQLSDKGLVRWYAACCRTPIGNTMRNPKLPFIGLIHLALDHSRMDVDFGHGVARVNTGAATGQPKPKPRRFVGAVLRFLSIVFWTRVSGRPGQSELFTETGSPIVRPTVLSAEELGRLKRGA
jgi:hypothetical protein